MRKSKQEFVYYRNKCRALNSSMKKIQIKKNMLILKDDEI